MTPRTAAKVDANQAEIVEALRGVGASVAHTHMIGRGFPDLLVCFRDNLYLLEIKDGSKPPSKRKLTEDEQAWHEAWKCAVHIVNSVDEALEAIGAVEKSRQDAPKWQKNGVSSDFEGDQVLEDRGGDIEAWEPPKNVRQIYRGKGEPGGKAK